VTSGDTFQAVAAIPHQRPADPPICIGFIEVIYKMRNVLNQEFEQWKEL
jgi:hypothetical protein